ncbi:uncharacterized protein BDR25DRAFT_353044 [Lindgomyces ingoldianus]|uniref:Uncharacterized protein n=1 Tax=Lindgomyces ingoldianus TaxID=673940 RepID=A0ACB6R0B7_9PLEO|nr:uncharacterized protein BDR25DRAFT_353044 [Lindgomyces ingoldianus]KAF2472713.1 hypothetical protein BDR25DRAFT_353044 [Lindgomyces ingoldianus]
MNRSLPIKVDGIGRLPLRSARYASAITILSLPNIVHAQQFPERYLNSLTSSVPTRRPKPLLTLEVVFITITDFTTATAGEHAPTSSLALPSTLSQSPSSIPSDIKLSTFRSSSLSGSSPPLTNTIPPLPSNFATPKPHLDSSNSTALLDLSPGASNTFLVVVVVFMAVMIIFYLALIGLYIWGRVKGSCPRCKRLEDKIKNLQGGEEPNRITVQMVKDRMGELEDNRIAAGGLPGGKMTAEGPRHSGEAGDYQFIRPQAFSVMFGWKGRGKQKVNDRYHRDENDPQNSWETWEEHTQSNVSIPSYRIPTPSPPLPAHHWNTRPLHRGISNLWGALTNCSPSSNSREDNPTRDFRDTQGDWGSFIEPNNGVPSNARAHYNTSYPYSSNAITLDTSYQPHTPYEMSTISHSDPDCEAYRRAAAAALQDGPDAAFHRENTKVITDRIHAREALERGDKTNGSRDNWDFGALVTDQAREGMNLPTRDQFVDIEIGSGGWWKGKNGSYLILILI